MKPGQANDGSFAWGQCMATGSSTYLHLHDGSKTRDLHSLYLDVIDGCFLLLVLGWLVNLSTECLLSSQWIAR